MPNTPQTGNNHIAQPTHAAETAIPAWHSAVGFRNLAAKVSSGDDQLGTILWRYLTAKIADKTPARPIPVQAVNPADCSGEHALKLTRLSHSTVLIKAGQHWLLTDPVFSKRASPSQLLGPARFHALPLELAEVPALSVVLISHDHYDHLDRASIEALHPRTAHFVVPLGVDQHLLRFGVPAEKIHVLDWWQHIDLCGMRFTATPAQHFSGRGLRDRNQTLWASYVIEAQQQKIFFGGDSGYFNGFAEIGRRYGPFDLTLLETGAYDELWPDIHMMPEQSLRAHLDLGGQYMLPIHNSSFDLAMHAWYEPLERITAAAQAYQVPLLTPQFGQWLDLQQLPVAASENQYWWRAFMPATALIAAPAQAEVWLAD